MIITSFTGLTCFALLASGLFVWRSFQLHHAGLAREWAEATARVLSRRDPMTGLFNRRAFINLLTERLLQQRIAVLLIDVDRFHLINSIHGQAVGDQVLLELASRLREHVSPSCELARVDGDTFAVLVQSRGGRLAAQAEAKQLLQGGTFKQEIGGRWIDVTVSIGVAISSEQGDTADNLLHAATAAVADAKLEGGSIVRFVEPSHESPGKDRHQLRQELRDAIFNGYIVPYYQPIVSLCDGRVVGFEVLARWVHPNRGVIAPDIFIPMAEELRLCGALSLSLLKAVIRDSQNWPSDFFFAFNASPSQLRELVGFIADPAIMPEHMLAPRRIELELTEGALIKDIDLASEVINLAHSLGARVVLDDFGIGHSNFFHLRALSFDRIKIDKSFIIDMGEDSRARACVVAMLALGHSLNIEMVAEGVETLETEQRLRQIGCHFGQGYLYSRPVPATRVPDLLAQNRRAQEPPMVVRLMAG